MFHFNENNEMEGLKYINQLKHNWQALKWSEALLYGAGTALMCWLGIDIQLWVLAIVFIAVTAIAVLLLQPWKVGLLQSAKLIDSQLDAAQNSAVLLVEMKPDSSMLYQLQQIKVGKALSESKGRINIPHHLLRAGLFGALAALTGFLFQKMTQQTVMIMEESSPQEIVFSPMDTTAVATELASIKKISVQIAPPAYSRLRKLNTTNPNLNVLEGTVIRWQIELSNPIEQLIIKSGGVEQPFSKSGETTFEGTWQAKNSGFYNFEYLSNGQRMVSEIYKIEVTKDALPEIEVVGINQHTRFNYWDAKKVDFTTLINDDFGVLEADIIATVAKGSGESVKFREEKLAFDDVFSSGARSIELNKAIDLDAMGLTPGDELYFYVQVTDNKEPEANINRTATYFLSIIDTTSVEFSLEGSLGVDQMPDYFRSQRQIIIETEQLVKDKSTLKELDFKSKSNELGFDQKALRLRYGQFMGEEFESGIMLEDAEGNAVEGQEDPLAAFFEDHDGDNEANLVDEVAKQKALLEKYIDNHEDGEEASFFTISIKQKLREAMNEMWDAELYLRLYEPEKSLPYQYRALELLKQIKNHARVYVHRIGFDPPPIKEDVRLSGDLEELKDMSNEAANAQTDQFKSIKKSISRMISMIESDSMPSSSDKRLFEAAGIELAALAIENPGQYLITLQQLKQLSFDNLPKEEVRLVLLLAYEGLTKVLPEKISQPRLTNAKMTELKRAYLKQFAVINND